MHSASLTVEGRSDGFTNPESKRHGSVVEPYLRHVLVHHPHFYPLLCRVDKGIQQPVPEELDGRREGALDPPDDEAIALTQQLCRLLPIVLPLDERLLYPRRDRLRLCREPG